MNLKLDEIEAAARAGLDAETIQEARAAANRLRDLLDEATFQDALRIVDLLRADRKAVPR